MRDPRHVIGEMVARESSLPRKLDKALTLGQPLISHRADRDDRDRLEWELSRRWRGLTDDIRKVKLVENTSVIYGLPEKWRRLEVELLEAPDVPPGEVILCRQQHERPRGWLLECLAPQPKIVAVCNTGQWDTARLKLQGLGYLVSNAAAPYTPHSEPWLIPGARG